MRIQSSGPSRCPVCLRDKDDAIKEQLEIGSSCGNPNCIFAEEIKRAIKDKDNNKFCINCGNQFSYGDIFCIRCGCKRK